MIKYFGTTLNETVKALSGTHLGTTNNKLGTTDNKNDKSKAVIRIVVSIVLCLVGAYLIIGQNKTTEGVALLTLVGGYWLR